MAVQFFGLIVAILIFVFMLMLVISDFPYNPNSPLTPVVIGVFPFLIPFYVATAKYTSSENENEEKFKHLVSIICVFTGLILGFVLLMTLFFYQESEWLLTVISTGLELIGATAAGLGIGLVEP